jgi:hypothetical protein
MESKEEICKAFMDDLASYMQTFVSFKMNPNKVTMEEFHSARNMLEVSLEVLLDYKENNCE